jgi:hypothetical protein
MSARAHVGSLALRTAPVALAILVVAGLLALNAQGAKSPVRPGHLAAAGKPFSAKLSYNETNHGMAKGQSTIGIQGKGTFSAKLSPHAALEAALMALATGVPVSKIAKGGSYTVQRNIAASGKVTGLAVLKFTLHSLGTVCISYTATPGRFVPGSSFVPVSGSFTTVGGTGSASTWKISAAFKETNVTGSAIEQLSGTGSEHASTGKARRMTAACKHVAAI